MTKKLDFYKCNICGNVIQILFEGEGSLVCCGHDMEKIELKNSDSDHMLKEKHTPKISKENGEYRIYIDNHPMSEEHYIMLLQTISDDRTEISSKYFYPNESIEMKTCYKGNILAYSYCNIHGLYKNEEE